MCSYSHDKGYRAEHAVELALIDAGYIGCYRPRAGSHDDAGDIGGVPIIVSVKDHTRLALAGWCDDMAQMVNRSGLATGVVWHKRGGRGDPLNWYVTTTGKFFLPLMGAYVKAMRDWGGGVR